MPAETASGSTETLESPAELAKKIKRLEEQLAKKDADIADLKDRNGKQANTLMELSDRIDKMESGSEHSKEINKSAETSDIEASLEAKFGDHTFNRGDIVTYTSSKGSEGKYYVLCNSYDDPPGLVLQSVDRDDLVFSISGDTDPNKIKPVEIEVENSTEVLSSKEYTENGTLTIKFIDEDGEEHIATYDILADPKNPYKSVIYRNNSSGQELLDLSAAGISMHELDGNTPYAGNDTYRWPDGELISVDFKAEKAEIPKISETEDNLDTEQVIEKTDTQINYEAKITQLNDVINKFAIARVDRERMLSGSSAIEEVALSGKELNDVFAEWATSLARVMDENYREITEKSKEATFNLESWRSELNRLGSLPTSERSSDYNKLISTAEENVRKLENYCSEIISRLEEVDKYQNSIINTQLLQIRKRVDDAMTAERERRHPLLSKVSNWLRTHKKTRMIVGVALTGAAIGSGAVGFAPGVAGALVARSAVQGFGGYNAFRGLGDSIADKGANKLAPKNIEEYTDAAKKQSSKKHRWNRGAALVGAGLAAAPLLRNLVNVADAPPPAQPAPKPPDWLASREFAEMVHHPETFKKFSSWIESMHAQGFTDDKIAQMMAKLPPAPEGFGS